MRVKTAPNVENLSLERITHNVHGINGQSREVNCGSGPKKVWTPRQPDRRSVAERPYMEVLQRAEYVSYNHHYGIAHT